MPSPPALPLSPFADACADDDARHVAAAQAGDLTALDALLRRHRPWVLGLALRARRRPVLTGIEEMVGSTGKVIDWSGDTGRIHVRGEAWQARLPAGEAALAAGAPVRIIALDGLTAIVEPQPETARR